MQLPQARLTACLFALGYALGVRGQDVVVERWPVPMLVDLEDVPTAMVIELRSQLIDTPFLDFSPGGDPDSAAMASFVDALVAGDIDDALAMTVEIPGVSSDDNRPLLDAFQMMFGEFPEFLHLDRVIHLGDDRLLVWSLPVEDGTEFVGSLRFQRDTDGELRYEGIQSDPLTSLITHTMDIGRATGPDERGPEAFTYDYVVPPTDDDPVRFRFNGVLLEVDAFNPLGPTGHAPVDFFNTSMGVFAAGGPFEYGQLFSPFSAERYIEWAQEQGDGYEVYRAETVNYGARVVFMLDADPVYLIFYLPTDTGIEGEPLRYGMVRRHPDGGFQLTNFFNFSFADMLFQRREYFEEPFLRPLLREEGLIVDNPTPERAVVPARGAQLPDPDAFVVPREPADEDEDGGPPPEDVDDLLREGSLWPWIAIFFLVVVVAAIALIIRQKRGGPRT